MPEGKGPASELRADTQRMTRSAAAAVKRQLAGEGFAIRDRRLSRHDEVAPTVRRQTWQVAIETDTRRAGLRLTVLVGHGTTRLLDVSIVLPAGG